MNIHGYDEALFERVVTCCTTPAERVVKILRWRGFIASEAQHRVYLEAGTPDDDSILLQELGVPCETLDEDGRKYRFEVVNPDAADASILFRIFSFDIPEKGWCSPRPLSSSWDNFQRCAYGDHVPVRQLDPGIALIVKLLPRLGLETIYSCDGHLETAPFIGFRGLHHLTWAQIVLPFFAATEFAEHWRFQIEGGWTESGWYISAPCGFELEQRYKSYAEIQALCKRILSDRDLAEIVRTSKKAFQEEDFRDVAPCRTRLQSIIGTRSPS